MLCSIPVVPTLWLATLLGGSQAGPVATPRHAGEGGVPAPGWFKAYLTHLTAADGRWTADNAEWRSATEPIEAYRTQWEWGIGKQSAAGRLSGFRDGKPTPDFWEFHLFWHPGRGEAIAIQFGGDGTVGEGTLAVEPGGTLEIVQTFVSPDGSTFRSRHVERMEGEDRVSTQYSWKGDAWVAGRTYRWRRP